MKNYYAILGVSSNASADKIKIAYRQSAKRYHPDLNPGNDNYKQRFVEIKEAYEILSNAESRKKYDNDAAAYRNAKQARQGYTQTQRGCGQTEGTQFRPQNGDAQFTPPFNNFFYSNSFNSNTSSSQKQTPAAPNQNAVMVEMKKIHALQLEFVKTSAKEELLKYKKRAEEQLKAYKKQAAVDLEKIKKQYKSACERMEKETTLYKGEYKKNSYSAGYKKGMKDAQNSAKKTVAELKKLIEQANSSDNKKEDEETGSRKLNKLKLELSLVNDKKRELENQIDVMEMDAKNAERFDYKKIEELNKKLAEAEEQVKELANERDSVRLQLQERTEEIDELNEELLHLEGYIKIWQEIGNDNKVTEDELELIEKYEGAQRIQAKDTLYGVLGLFLNALPEEIEAAYERLRSRYAGNDKYLERHINIIEAYSILSDPEQKQAYDLSINNGTEL